MVEVDRMSNDIPIIIINGTLLSQRQALALKTALRVQERQARASVPSEAEREESGYLRMLKEIDRVIKGE